MTKLVSIMILEDDTLLVDENWRQLPPFESGDVVEVPAWYAKRLVELEVAVYDDGTGLESVEDNGDQSRADVVADDNGDGSAEGSTEKLAAPATKTQRTGGRPRKTA